MGPSNIVLFFACLIALPTFLTFLSLLYSHPPKGQLATESTSIGNGRLLAFFAFRAPSTLFPSSAIISLTDDNSTFFLARPADFGPKLAPDGFSGQLWIGTGFGDSSLKSGPTTLGAEGELGCSDVPGWRESESHFHGDSLQTMYIDARAEIHENRPLSSSNNDRAEPAQEKKDGTDDYLHTSHLETSAAEPSGLGRGRQPEPSTSRYSIPHADIRSLQESAEITGKIVLLSRGGCGFLEKVMWAQHRGAAALIVGDDTPGGPLITMFARGDTSNVTIPSLFTSHTTAHLLATLIPLDQPARKSGLKDPPKSSKSNGRAGSLVWGDRGIEVNAADHDQGIVKRAVMGSKKPSNSAQSRLADAESAPQKGQRQNDPHKAEDLGWLHRILSRTGLEKRSHKSDLSADSRRPPSSGRLNWIDGKLSDDPPRAQSNNMKQGSAVTKYVADEKVHDDASTRGPVDDFVIGVQDWRDKDLVAQIPSSDDSSPTEITATKAKSLLSKAAAGIGEKPNGIGASIITPGSGEYESESRELKRKDKSPEKDLARGASTGAGGSQTWLSQMLDREDGEESITPELSRGAFNSGSAIQQGTHSSPKNGNQNSQDDQEEREGLWVTLTPSTMSTSPFLDTLLVLVVSPLITLTVVYALLLLRSRIRRRRWRAPKSVVGRLPVRTYHTMSCSSISSSPRSVTPPASSPTSPLFQTASPSTSTCPRPRSRTASTADRSVYPVPDHVAPDVSLEQSGNQTRSSGGKRKYAGRQIECVVCLEEYVDGHSRVMSLPCGHEFHAECMYVWYCHS